MLYSLEAKKASSLKSWKSEKKYNFLFQNPLQSSVNWISNIMLLLEVVLRNNEMQLPQWSVQKLRENLIFMS